MTILTEDDTVSSHVEATASPSGILLLDKPQGITSHDAVDLARRIYKTRRVGHAGTLDPMASGLLLVMVGDATKIARYLTGLDKTYTATVRFGWSSSTGDADGELRPDGDATQLTEHQIRTSVAAHRGMISQLIPAYAAKRTNGKRRYEMARAGQPVPDMTRDVTIHEIELLDWSAPDAVVRVRCSSGTYIRSLAESMGRTVNCGGYLTALRREAIAEWSVAQAHTVDALPGSPELRSIDDFLTYPSLVLAEESMRLIRNGNPILRLHVDHVDGEFNNGALVVMRSTGGHVLAVGRALCESGQWDALSKDEPVFRYERVLI